MCVFIFFLFRLVRVVCMACATDLEKIICNVLDLHSLHTKVAATLVRILIVSSKRTVRSGRGSYMIEIDYQPGKLCTQIILLWKRLDCSFDQHVFIDFNVGTEDEPFFSNLFLNL